MSKKKEASTEEMLNEAFKQWTDVVSNLETQANNGFMPLLAKSFALSKEILAMYEKAFKAGLIKE